LETRVQLPMGNSAEIHFKVMGEFTGPLFAWWNGNWQTTVPGVFFLVLCGPLLSTNDMNGGEAKVALFVQFVRFMGH